MRQLGVVALVVAISVWLAVSLEAQPRTVEAHNLQSAISTINLEVRPRLVGRSLLGLINTSAVVLYCTTDGTTATSSPVSGIRLEANGTTGDRVFLERSVPLGAINCVSASGSGNWLLIIEGR